VYIPSKRISIDDLYNIKNVCKTYVCLFIYMLYSNYIRHLLDNIYIYENKILIYSDSRNWFISNFFWECVNKNIGKIIDIFLFIYYIDIEKPSSLIAFFESVSCGQLCNMYIGSVSWVTVSTLTTWRRLITHFDAITDDVSAISGEKNNPSRVIFVLNASILLLNPMIAVCTAL